MLTILIFLLQFNGAWALDVKDLKAGMTVQISQNLVVNRLHSDGILLCYEAGKGYFPKVSVGPQVGADVPAQYFTVTKVASDLAGHEVSLRSEQMPCSCVLSLEQRPERFGGAGSDFKMLSPATAVEMDQVPSVPTSCKNTPQWINL